MLTINNPVHVIVTQEDIDMGKKQSCRDCPIALAIRRVLQEATFIDVTWIFAVTDWHYAHLPEVAREFIAKFDFTRAAVEPFEFDLTFFKR